MGCCVLRKPTKFAPSQVVPAFEPEESNIKKYISEEKAYLSEKRASGTPYANASGESGSSQPVESGGDSDEEESLASSSDDGPCSPEDLWARQARKIQSQEKRRKRAERKAKSGRPSRGKNIDLAYSIGDRLGQGTYSSVSRCTHLVTGVQRALKSIERKKAPSPKQITEEIEVMRVLGEDKHSNIIHLHEIFEDSKHVHLVLELCTGGELFESISTLATSGFAEPIAAQISKQLASAVLYMHTKQVAHRDLKPENFMLEERKAVTKTTIKTIDFGLSKRFIPGEFMTTSACTPHYVAPEVLNNHYTEACDLWSLGVLVFVLLCGTPPFHGATHSEILANVRTGAFKFSSPPWKHVSAKAKDLINSLLVLDVAARATAKQAMEHEWLSSSQ